MYGALYAIPPSRTGTSEVRAEHPPQARRGAPRRQQHAYSRAERCSKRSRDRDAGERPLDIRRARRERTVHDDGLLDPRCVVCVLLEPEAVWRQRGAAGINAVRIRSQSAGSLAGDATDLYVAGGIAFTLYFFWQLLHRPSTALTITTGLALDSRRFRSTPPLHCFRCLRSLERSSTPRCSGVRGANIASMHCFAAPGASAASPPPLADPRPCGTRLIPPLSLKSSSRHPTMRSF